MRDQLPDNVLRGCGVLNLDDSNGPGTHWTAWYGNAYFDSYGLPPPEEFLDKTGDEIIEYNDLGVQTFYDPPFCGHLCLGFLEAMHNGKSPNDYVLSILRINGCQLLSQ